MVLNQVVRTDGADCGVKKARRARAWMPIRTSMPVQASSVGRVRGSYSPTVCGPASPLRVVTSSMKLMS